MPELGLIIAFAAAHLAAWVALGGGWRGAARAPFKVIVPAAALVVLNAVFFDSYASLALNLGTLLTWELCYVFGYLCLRIIARPAAAPASS